MNRLPAEAAIQCGSASLEVLNLFAHLLDQNLQFNRRVGHFDRGGFRAQRVGFAIEFLHQEVKAATDCAAGRKHAAHFGDVRRQAA